MSRIFLAGASGVIGQRLIPLHVNAGHTVAGMTRSASKAGRLAELGAEPVVVDVFDRDALIAAVVGFKPDIILNELTRSPSSAASTLAFAPRAPRTSSTRPARAVPRRSSPRP
jgi:uncharacterized protein YbjT (DUF2867 family)